jgi:hypothetical protein
MKPHNYCKACGSKLQFSEAETCPYCHINFENSYLYYFNYCPVCGKKLDYTKGDPLEICPNCGVRINKKFEFYISDFVYDNSRLLTILGVFIALALYLSQIAVIVNKTNFTYIFEGFQFNVLDLSIGGCIFLAILIACVIIKKIVSEYFRIQINRYSKPWYSLSGLKIAFVLTAFCFLILGIFLYFYITYKIVFGIFLLISLIAISIIIELGLIKFLKRINEINLREVLHDNPYYVLELGILTITLYGLYKITLWNGPLFFVSGVLLIVGLLIFLDFIGNFMIYLVKWLFGRRKQKITKDNKND